MGGTLVNLVQLGFLGFAVAIMFLAFRLLQELVKNQGQNPQSLKLKMISVIFFMGLSVVVIALGIWFSFKDPARQVTIALNLYPKDDEMLSVINVRGPFVGEEEPNFAETLLMQVRNESEVTIDFLDLRDALVALKREKEANARRAEGALQQNSDLLSSTLVAPDQGQDLTGGEQGI